MSEEGEVGGFINGSCQICTTGQAKYRCPGCGKWSCSLGCIQKHKVDMGCTGKRQRSYKTFTPAAKLTSEILFDDQRLLEEADSMVGSAKSVDHNRRQLHYLQKQCRERNIHLALMPSGMMRAQHNKSCVLRGNKILWTIEWILLEETPEHPVNMKLDQLRPFIKVVHYSDCLESDEVANSYQKLPSILDPEKVEFLLKLEADIDPSFTVVDISPTRRLWTIHCPQTSWSLLLANRTVIEFPTVYVCKKILSTR